METEETTETQTEEKPEPKTYTEAEVESRLRGSGKKIQSLESELAELRAKEAQREEEASKRKGEFEKLYADKKSEYDALEIENKALKERVESHEKLMADEIKAQVAEITKRDESFGKILKEDLAGRSVLDQRRILSLLNRKRTVEQPKTSPGGGHGGGHSRETSLKDDPREAGVEILRRKREARLLQ